MLRVRRRSRKIHCVFHRKKRALDFYFYLNAQLPARRRCDSLMYRSRGV